jgi:hypothetical protein
MTNATTPAQQIKILGLAGFIVTFLGFMVCRVAFGPVR